ncbi:MAG TPA: tRNA (adenosine(37)-N6)-threonylcarbamoyltransferase complex transferase subunit TsaD [Vicinamibacterales bacterium]|nr:tRNA (adenosine(37)-N6)-threonylcarbamoyltransferase complex transferase subunit TsaD [Vicinamibacterales bacterium]
MQMLGIETSCDETSAAVVEERDGTWTMRSNIVSSQVNIHRDWGGVVPELASRQHIRDICGVVRSSLDTAGVDWAGIDAVAVTQGPGLVGSLLVGVSFAKSVAWSLSRPLVPVHHLAGHVESLFLEQGRTDSIPLPLVTLVVSGGHTSLYVVREPGSYERVGRTRDDAAGEAYDKVAKLLGLGYPGGPIVDRLAREGNDQAIDLPATRMTHADRNAPSMKGDLDFSFSGLKTAVMRFVRGRAAADPRAAGVALSPGEIADVCASFQRVVATTLLDRLFDAAERFGARSVGIAGGVSANSRLREDLVERGRRDGLPVFIPRISLSTDNAAMIAAAGLRNFHAGVRAGWNLNADPSLEL